VIFRERRCPACGETRVRSYFHPSSRWLGPDRPPAPTLQSYGWCASCHRYDGSTGPLPAGFTVNDPLSEADQNRFAGDLFGFLDHLNTLWDEGKLPQTPG
jgi:hypothetical protein